MVCALVTAFKCHNVSTYGCPFLLDQTHGLQNISYAEQWIAELYMTSRYWNGEEGSQTKEQITDGQGS